MYAALTETTQSYKPILRPRRYRTERSLVVRGMDPNEFLRTMSSHMRRNVRAKVVDGAVHFALVDLIPEDLKVAKGRPGCRNKMSAGVRKFLCKNIGKDRVKTVSIRSTAVGTKKCTVVPGDAIGIVATYVFYKSKGLDFRACYSDLPDPLKVTAPTHVKALDDDMAGW